ncbi:hypothetical protein BsWGS_23094 [Bradybaena similaris]
MSVTRVSKAGSIRELRLKSRGKTQPIPALAVIERSRHSQEQITPEMYASKIREVTSRLSRPTIASSLKTVHGRPEVKSERDSQFWNTMAYCSTQYQKKFIGQSTRPAPAVTSQPHRRQFPTTRCQPDLCSASHTNPAGNTLPMLANQRGPGCRN